MVENANQKVVPILCESGPSLNSSFILCSKVHTRRPSMINDTKVANQRFQVRGFRNTHGFSLSLSLTRTTIDTPDSVNGNVKSTYCDLFATMVISPTATS